MRLIDADELMKHACELEDGLFFIDAVPIGDIGEAPTIDPVKHAHWVENPIGCNCSACGEIHRYDILTANMTHLYCNHCGAKMDEESKS